MLAKLPISPHLLAHHSPTVLNAMNQWKSQSRVPPVLLMTGLKGVGKRELVYHIAQWLLCEKNGLHLALPDEEQETSLFGDMPTTPAQASSQSPEPCQECGACKRAVSGNWINFKEITPHEDDADAKNPALKIEQFRELKKSMGFGAYEGGYKITLIPEAERLTVQSANSLLKLLEEPPPGWVFFLTASDPSLLLPTIVSRCQVLRVKPFSEKALLDILNESEIPKDRHAVCARLAQGSLGKALALGENELWSKRVTFFRFLEKPSSELNGLMDWAVLETENFDLLLDQLEQLSADLIGWSMGSPLINTDGKKSLEIHAKAVTLKLGSMAGARAFWTERATRLFQIRKEALAPLNRKLLLQDILIPFLEVT